MAVPIFDPAKPDQDQEQREERGEKRRRERREGRKRERRKGMFISMTSWSRRPGVFFPTPPTLETWLIVTRLAVVITSSCQFTRLSS